MNAAHLHVILNHIPVIGVPIGFALLIYGLLRKSTEVLRAALLLLVAMGIVAIPTFLSGQAAEDIVEHLPGVGHDVIENHEGAATIAFAVTLALGTVALGALLWSFRSGTVGVPLVIVLLLFSGGVSGWLARTANLGGQIRHTEFQPGGSEGAEAEEEREEADGEEAERHPRDERDERGDRRGRNRRRRGR
ncbi:MAG TPA: hypothetical protein VG095_00555 [Chthoniobacterales bacterium]|nr:hypothetical protein [Chthoniobacterales bacterium]